ncbi:L-lactate permease [Actinoplanes subtropicus]|uniref:L-lactate permease n=1 Tax=Actinoplanes subtropicus TaxID=543632 RepID=UPI001FDF0CA1|nr:L-lactate permease [Actinoplanes subtropicus]
MTDPVGGSLALSAIFAVLPLLTLFVLLGVLRMRAWLAGVISLVVSLAVAIIGYSMPVGQALLSATEGAAFGFFPILWIVLNAIWVYNLTVVSGHFDVLRRSMARVSPDMRIQAIIVAFCFGALLEALAGFGTPVAVTVVMLMALGFPPVRAAAVALIANTAPVAFGALATPIVTLGTVASGAAEDPRLNTETIGAMVGRQTPVLALIVPLVLVAVIDGRRGMRQTWPAAAVAGVVFAGAQFTASNYISVPLTDIVASLASAAAVVLLLRVWRPSEVPPLHEPAAATVGTVATGDGRTVEGNGRKGAGGTDDTAPQNGDKSGMLGGGEAEQPAVGEGFDTYGRSGGMLDQRDRPAEILRAYAPYLIVILLFSIVNLGPIKTALAKEPWTVVFAWPGLHVLGATGKPVSSTTFTFGWLPAAGTLMIIAGILTAIVLRVRPGRAIKAYRETYWSLRHAIVTVMAVLALAYVMNQSGQTNTLGGFLAQAGGFFVFLSSILGWIGVAVTGSDTSSNALFGALQVQTATKAGLDPLLLAAANSSGGVLGKMISPQNLAIAAAAVGMAGREGDIFRRVIGWSAVLLAAMCVLVTLQGTPVLSWMIP